MITADFKKAFEILKINIDWIEKWESGEGTILMNNDPIYLTEEDYLCLTNCLKECED